MNEPEKIIQIVATSGGEDNTTDELYALTDSGRIFRLHDAANGDINGMNWRLLPAIPKDNTP